MRTQLRGSLGAVVLAGATLAFVGTGSGPATADHGDDPSNGTYRIPYEDGADITVTGDAHNHGGPNGNRNRIDMVGDNSVVVVAAADGVVRWVDDHNGDDDDRGDGADRDGVPYADGDEGDALEHTCQDDDLVPGLCQEYNNFVWIEHPNGEWTKYTHLRTGSASIDAGWAAGDPISAGETIGIEGDIGFATGPHLHWEVAVPTDPTDPQPFSTLGGFIEGTNRTSVVCDIEGNRYVSGESYTANPCDHEPPVADAGGPYSVDEGSNVVLDGTGSNDGDGGTDLTYLWSPASFADGSGLDDTGVAAPTFTAVEGPAAHDTTLMVYDQVEQLPDSDDATITVENVAPTVTATGDSIEEAGTATVLASFADPGVLDTHVASIDWGDGGPDSTGITPASLAAGVDHVYGDNGTYAVTVSVADDDGGVGTDEVDVVVGNLDPTVTIDVSDAVSFPGGDHLVVEAGTALPVTADGADAGSDDLTFTWNLPAGTTYFNDGVGPEPAEPPTPTPFGVFPFAASDDADALFGFPGVADLGLVVTDDDDGTASASTAVIVTGTADETKGSGWWKHQYAGTGSPHIEPVLADAYLDIVAAVSSVFAEQTALATAADAHSVLSPSGAGHRARAESELLQAWLEFASGAVPVDAVVPLVGGGTIGYLDLMFAAEATILDATATGAELHDVERQLAAVRTAG